MIGDTCIQVFIKLYDNNKLFFNALKKVYDNIKSIRFVYADYYEFLSYEYDIEHRMIVVLARRYHKTSVNIRKFVFNEFKKIHNPISKSTIKNKYLKYKASKISNYETI